MISRRNFIMGAAAALAVAPALPLPAGSTYTFEGANIGAASEWRSMYWGVVLTPCGSDLIVDESIDRMALQAFERNAKEFRNFRRDFSYDSRERIMHVIYTAEVR